MVSLVALSFLQRPGLTTFDTKFDLTADPGSFLARTLHLWNPQLSFGELQNQAYGYLFPQGTFFWGGDLLGLPDWIVQRSWSALVLVVAYEGARRLYRALTDVESPWLPIVAGAAYALAPRLLGLSGVLTAEVLPTAVLPWVVLPLVHSLRSRSSPLYGAVLSGAAVLFMGGVNAVENVATFPLPALLLICSLGTYRGRRLALYWVGAVSLASVWWILPLLVLGRYSPPFLDYIETSAATTFPLGWVNATRGADHWLAFISVSGEKWWPGAFDLATEPHLIAVTALVGAVSLAGLFHPTMPARLPLALSALLGLVLLTVAHAAPLSSPLSEQVRSLLDGSLALLRNVHKVDPLVRLPFALGFAHATGVLMVRARDGSGSRVRSGALRRALVILGASSLLLVSGQPLFGEDLRKPGWSVVPNAWQQTADYLAVNAHGRRALVLPGSGFGQQTWGWTIDEPLQGLARSPWVSRTQVPLVPGPTIRFLDSIEDRVQDGRGSPALADVLARAGIGYVVVRRDLDLFASGAPTPTRVDQAIERSPGLVQEAGFGSSGLGNQPLISVYGVARAVPRVEAVDLADTARFAGGPEDVITLLEAGALAPGQAALVSTQSGSDRPPDFVADGYRLRERQFGRLRDSLSQIMTRQEPYRNDRRAHDYPGVPGIERASAVYPDISSLSASSSSGYADTLGPVRPELGPYSAVDGLPSTYWRSAPLENPRGQWLEVRLRHPQPLDHLDVTLGVDGFSGVPVRRIRVDAGGQVSEHPVDPTTGVVRVSLTGALVDRVRITVLATLGDPARGVVAIREISFPGLTLGRDLDVPDAGAGGSTGFVFRAQPDRRACAHADRIVSCEADSARPGEEEAGLYRQFHTDGGGAWTISGTVTARASPETAQLLWPLRDRARVGASSVLTNDPSVSGQFAFDGDPATAWLSAAGDLRAALVLRWDRPRTLTRLRVLPAAAPSRAPVVAEIESDGERRRVDVGAGSFGVFPPLRTDHVTITFPMDPSRRDAEALPLGVGELVIDGLRDQTYAPDPAARTGAPCGLGPMVVVDGQTVKTRVVGRIQDVTGGSPMRLEPCGENAVQLGPGDHHLSVASTDRFAPTTFDLVPQDRSRPTTLGTRSTEIKRWDSTRRTVVVGPGREAVLRVPENVNAGWRATLDGRVLATVPVDGWQQGYRVPAGSGGVVQLEYTPDRLYRASLLTGAGAGVLLVLVCLWVWRRERTRVPGSAELPAGTRGTLPSGRIGVGALLAIAWLGGGIALLAGALVGFALRGCPGARRSAAVVVVGVAGVAAAVLTQIDSHGSWRLLDVATGSAIGMLLASLTSAESSVVPRAEPGED